MQLVQFGATLVLCLALNKFDSPVSSGPSGGKRLTFRHNNRS